MKQPFTWRAGILALAWFGVAIAVSAQPVVWVTPSLQRTGPSDPAGSGTQASISAGKGEYESFQIVVRGPASGLTNVNVTVSTLTGPGGATIPSTSFSLFRENYVTVSPGSPNWGGSNQPLGAGVYADGLIPFNDPNTGASLYNSGAQLVAVPFNLNASANQPIWVDLLVPRTAVAGQYSGTFTVSSGQGSTSGTIALTVWNFTLPLKPTFRSTFEYWNTSGLSSDQELLRNKVEPMREAYSEQSTLMSGYGLGDVALSYYSGASNSNCTMSAPPSVAAIQASVAAQTPGLVPYDFSADEITACPSLDPMIQQWAYNLHQAGVQNMATIAPTTALFSDGSGSGRSAVDIWAMLPVVYEGALTATAQALAKGDQVWSYNTLVQDSYSPKWEIDFAPINFRIEPGFISQSLGLTGLLYWKTDGWNASNPWGQVNNTGEFSSNNYPGDGQLVYPGTQVGISGVAPSMRLKWIRDGVEDFEYVAMLKALGQGSQALALSQSVGPDWTNWTRDINQLASVRQQLGTLLNQLNGGGSGGSSGPAAPSAPANPSPATGSSGVSSSPTLSWGAAANATSYNVYFGTSSSPAMVTSTTSTSYSPSGLAAGTTYYWQIIASNSAGTAASPVWSFSTAASGGGGGGGGTAVPPKPLNPSPAIGATGVSLSAALSWGAATGATSYSVYFGSTSVALVATVTGTTYTPTLAPNTTYTWGVVANNSAGTNSSATWTFTTGASGSGSAPAAPANPNPANGATGIATSPVLSWGASANATSYSVYFGTSASPALVTSTTGTTYSPGVLSGSTKYYWSVTATNGTGSAASATWSFTTSASGAPTAVSASPNSGNALQETLTLTYGDANGFADISGASAIINSSVNGANACWFYYNRAGNTLSLANNSTSAWSTFPQGGTVSNSQCTITNFSATGSGNTLTLVVSITYSSGFAGSRNVYGYVQNNAGLNSGYQVLGSWTVP